MFLTASNRSGRPSEKPMLNEPDEHQAAPLLSCYCRQTKKKTPTKKTSQIRSIALIFFLLACLYWLYKVYTNATGLGGNNSARDNDGGGGSGESRSKLKLINVFNRHGDRAPNSLPPGDEFNQRPKFFWPNGLSNLTDTGKFRTFRMGLELRKRYEDLLDYNASHYLAFSSPLYRCQESLEHTLHGLFDLDWPISRGLNLISRYNADVAGNKDCLASAATASSSSLSTSQSDSRSKPNVDSTTTSATTISCSRSQHLILPNGAGSPSEYKRITIDTTTIPTLTYDYLNNCTYRREHPTPIDRNLSASNAIAQLKGIKRLEEILETNYGRQWDFGALSLHSTLGAELRLARTRDTINYGRRNFDWLTQLVPEYNSATGITLADLYEQATVFGYRDRIVGTADYIQLGPMISSVIKSQQVALRGQADGKKMDPNGTIKFDSAQLYAGKKAIIYSTHDSILQQLLHRLGFIRADGADFETRFSEKRDADDVEQFLAGLKMSKYGMSLVFELYEMDADQRTPIAEDDDTNDQMIGNGKFAFVQVSLYNQEDGKYKAIEYKKLKLGQLCRRLFQEQNPLSTKAQLDSSFYDPDEFPLDPDFSCPFELFKNVTSHFMINSNRLDELCKA
uniref:acid phosphatase n=1 Tax=Aceria tosichella TaxID=561515 RepID=A0A6G1SIW7_9ACAR